MHTLRNNFVLHRRYTILHVIAQGGFGITYAAVDDKTGQKVCVKELYISGCSTRASDMSVVSQSTEDMDFDYFVRNFMAEANQLSRFNHPSIVKITNFFQENSTAYMVMNFIEGETLKEKILQNGPMKFEAAGSLIFQISEALELVHQQNMLHRDIKPDNIIITPAKRAVLIDFGSAREFSENKTMTQTTMITPGYAPIEQYNNSSRKGTYTDIYALGATLYFLLTGKKPLDATERFNTELKAPHEINPAISSQISSAVMLAMQMKAADRFQKVSELKSVLNKLNKQKTNQNTQKTNFNFQTLLNKKGILNDDELVGFLLLMIIIIILFVFIF